MGSEELIMMVAKKNSEIKFKTNINFVPLEDRLESLFFLLGQQRFSTNKLFEIFCYLKRNQKTLADSKELITLIAKDNEVK